MDPHFWLVFVATVFGVSLIPGPSTLIAFAHGARFGTARVLFTAGGNASASLLQALAASVGLGLVITTSALLFTIIKYLGAAYLVFVGIQMWRSASRRMRFGDDCQVDHGRAARLFSNGFLVAASNPKAIAFFTALFPQFLSVDGNSTMQLAAMVVVVGAVAFSVAAIYGMLGAWVRSLELSRKAITRLYKTTGGLFVASGVGLAAARN